MNDKKLESYLSLSTQFYDAIRPNPPEESYNFYQCYVQNTHGFILEPMCGSGRFLLPLLQEGFNVQGFDASTHMLEALQAKASLLHLKPKIWQDFAEDLNVPTKYNLIFIPSGSFGHIIELEKVKRVLQLFYDHLNDDGILVFEVESSKTVPQPLGVWRGSMCERQDGNKILLSRLTTFKDNVCCSIDKYELVHAHQIIQTEVEVFNVRVYDEPKILIDMLKTISFKKIRAFKAFDVTALPNENDASIVLECTK